MSNQVLGYYINNKSEVKTVVKTDTECVSFTNSSTDNTTPVKVCPKKETPNVQVVLELTPNKNEGFIESEEFELYPDIDTLWTSFKVNE